MRRKIQIKNLTHWKTSHLRTFVIRTAKEVLDDHEKPTLRVEFRYARRREGSCSGYAWYHSMDLVIRLPSQITDKIDLAHVITHEIAHTKGLKHGDMRGSAIYMRVGRYREIYAWAADLPLEKNSPKQRVRLIGPALAQTNAEKAAAKIKLLLARIKRQTNLLKKWQKRERYYLKRAENLKDAPSVPGPRAPGP